MMTTIEKKTLYLLHVVLKEIQECAAVEECGSDPVARIVLGGVLGWIAKRTIPLPSMVSADQGCAATRGPRATVRLGGPTWEDPASIRNPPGSQSCRSKPTPIAATTSRNSGIG